MVQRFLLLWLLAVAGPAAGQVSFCAIGAEESVQGSLADFSFDALIEEDGDGEPVRAIAPAGVSDWALSEAKRMAQEMLRKSPAALPDNLRRARVFVVVIPKAKKLTDVKEFEGLRGRKVGDGRGLWDDVRGVGFWGQADGSVAVAAGEENFLIGERGWGPSGWDYPKGYLLVHEFSHAIYYYGFPKPEHDSVQTMYEARKTAGLPFPNDYSSSDVHEYFAEGSSTYFGLHDASRQEKDVAWIRAQDKALYGMLLWAFGLPRGIAPRPKPLALPESIAQIPALRLIEAFSPRW